MIKRSLFVKNKIMLGLSAAVMGAAATSVHAASLRLVISKLPSIRLFLMVKAFALKIVTLISSVKVIIHSLTGMVIKQPLATPSILRHKSGHNRGPIQIMVMLVT